MKTPREYQKRCIRIGRERNALFALQGGLGKTLPAIFVCQEYSGPKLVICTNMAKEQWKAEILDVDPLAVIVTLGKAGKLPADVPDYFWNSFDDRIYRPDVWVITHWESLIYCGPELAKHQWDAVIADEAHRIMNRHAKRTMWTKLIRAERKLALTGTPFEKNLDQMWSILNWLYKPEFKSYWTFVSRYMIQEMAWHGHLELKGPNMATLPHLIQQIAPFTVRLTKQEAFPEMPPKVDSVIHVAMTDKQQAVYEHVAKSRDIEFRYTEVDLIIRNALTLMVRLQQITSDPALLGFVAIAAKLEWLDEWLWDNPDEKVVVFSKFRETALKISGAHKAPCIVGGEKEPARQIAKFGSRYHRLLVGTIAAMGESLDIPMASTAIFIDQEWSSLKMAQAVERIDRAVDNPVAKNIIRLIVPNTIDELVMQALTEKWSQQELVFHFLQQSGIAAGQKGGLP